MIQKFAFVFPGQGSQSIGMLSNFSEAHSIIQETFYEASESLGYDLWALTQEGPSEKLNQTQYTQPALLTAGIALWRLYQQEKPVRPLVLAGHSLGEYAALVCAGSLEFLDAVHLVAERGRLMQAAVPEGRGAMAAILGLSDEEVRKVCDEAREGEIVEPANFNSVGQVVIAGQVSAVTRAIEKAKTYGAKRSILLPVSVPSHCRLMKSASEQFEKVLTTVSFKEPSIPVIHNVDVATHTDPFHIRRILSMQLYSPVRWVETIQAMVSKGVECILECGPGTILSGLNKRIAPSAVSCVSLSSGEALCL